MLSFLLKSFFNLKSNFIINKKENKVLFVLGIFFLILNLIKAFFIYWPRDTVYILELFWGCNFASFIISFYLIFGKIKSIRMVASSLFVLAVAIQSPWTIGFVLDYFGLYNLPRIAAFADLLTYEGFYYKFIYMLSFLEHSLLIPILFFVIYKLGFDFKSYRLSILIFSFLTTISFLSPENLNINCVKYSCDDIRKYDHIVFNYDFHYLFYFVLTWSIILFLTHYISFYIFNYIKK